MQEKLSKSLIILTAAVILTGIFSITLNGQPVGSIPYKSQEVSEIDGIPVLVKHLPDWEGVYTQTVFAVDIEKLKSAIGDRTILDVIDFSGGTEAVTAQYDAGRLLIIEYTTPQGSIDADKRFNAALDESENNSTVYRRIGNYNVLVFDAVNKSAANGLIDQVKYEKDITWLGENPFRISAERVFVLTTANIFTSTVWVIVLGIGLSIVVGVVVGCIFFLLRKKRRATQTTYTDAGGMTRLNLDGFTPDITP